jgi:hypothetical protein
MKPTEASHDNTKRSTMLKALLLVPVVALIAAGPALASDSKCNVPQAEWQPRAALEAKLKADGWKEIKKMKEDNGCYEVYGFDAKGEKRETYFNPKTFDVVGEDD